MEGWNIKKKKHDVGKDAEVLFGLNGKKKKMVMSNMTTKMGNWP